MHGATVTDPETLPPDIGARKHTFGRAGFVLGCVAAVIAALLNLRRAPQPLSLGIAVLSILIAALNVPLGIGLGLLVERLSRTRPE